MVYLVASNLFLNDKMAIKLGDFGLATKLDFEGEKKRTICKIQHLKYTAHITRFNNASLQKHLLFKTDWKKYSRDIWVNMELELSISK